MFERPTDCLACIVIVSVATLGGLILFAGLLSAVIRAVEIIFG